MDPDAERLAAFAKAGGAGPKNRRKAIRSYERLIAEHEAKYAAAPDSPDRAHWEAEIRAFQESKAKHERRLGR